MKQELVSIIVPVYKVTGYLQECVDSVLAQSYQNLELILVDDGSPDECGSICDACAARDNRVKVIHKPNGGAASARNAGLDAAAGDYICFVDSDDTVAPDYLAELMAHIGGADIAVCGFTLHTRGGKVPCGECEDPGIYGREEYLRRFLKNWTCALLWNKLFRKNVIGSLRMEEGHRIDDEFFTYQVVLSAEKILAFDKPLYHYRLRRSSVMQDTAGAAARLLLDRIAYTRQRYGRVCEQAPALKEAFFVDQVDSFARYWTMCAGMPEVKKTIKSWTRKNLAAILGSSMTWKQKLIYVNALLLKPAGNASPGDRMEADAGELFE